MHLKLLQNEYLKKKKTVEVTGELIGNKIADKVANSCYIKTRKVSKTIKSEKKIELNNEIPRKRLLQSAKRQQLNYKLRSYNI